MFLRSASDIGSVALGIAWIGVVAIGVSAVVVLDSRRRDAESVTIVSRVVAIWLAAALIAAAVLTLEPLSAEFSAADPQLNPLLPINGRDALDNVMLYVPVGFFAALLLRSRPNPVLLAVFVVFGASLTLEVAQWVFPINRAASIHDLLFNTIGGLLGAIAGTVTVRLARRLT